MILVRCVRTVIGRPADLLQVLHFFCLFTCPTLPCGMAFPLEQLTGKVKVSGYMSWVGLQNRQTTLW